MKSKFVWKKAVSIGGSNAKFIKVDGQIGHIEFDSEEDANKALEYFGCSTDALFENWHLVNI